MFFHDVKYTFPIQPFLLMWLGIIKLGTLQPKHQGGLSKPVHTTKLSDL